MNQPLISIVMPVKNAVSYLNKCIHSILDQSYINWELFAVNDHSTDNSYALLEEFDRKDERIHVLNNNGKGIIDALRTGYSKSNGTCITRMDADDIMPVNKLKTLSRLLVQSGKGYVATGFVKYFSESKLGEGYLKYQNWLNRLTDNQSNYSEIYKECPIASPCWMVWKEDFENCGGFNSNIYPEDYELVFRFYSNGLKITSSSEILHLWRDSPGRASRNDENYKDNRFLELKLAKFLEIDYSSSSSLVLWGAGKKGKALARFLISKNIPFSWICNTPSKIGHNIYNVKLEGVENRTLVNTQIIIAVANESDQQTIQEHLKNNGAENYYYFC